MSHNNPKFWSNDFSSASAACVPPPPQSAQLHLTRGLPSLYPPCHSTVPLLPLLLLGVLINVRRTLTSEPTATSKVPSPCLPVAPPRTVGAAFSSHLNAQQTCSVPSAPWDTLHSLGGGERAAEIVTRRALIFTLQSSPHALLYLLFYYFFFSSRMRDELFKWGTTRWWAETCEFSLVWVSADFDSAPN